MTESEDIKKIEAEPAKSKYELTLSEFPIFILSKKADKGIKAILYEDTINGKNNEPVKREWKVLPDAEHGFGTASTFATLYDLFQIWKETNFNGQFIYFHSIYSLLKRRGQSTSNQQYKQITKDLNCLVGVRITAKNAFWDNERRAYVDMTFHLFDQLDLFKEKPQGQATLPFARIKASGVLYASVQKNSLLTADFDSQFFYSLTPIEQRLSLYLSKIFRSQTKHKRELLEFAQQIPIQAKQTKHIKERLKKACAGLMQKGFKLLASFNFEKGADGKTEFIVFRRQGSPRQGKAIAKYQPGTVKESYEIEALTEDILEVCQDVKSTGFYRKVAMLMPRQDIYRALSEVKEIRDTGEIKTSAGALFTSLIKKYAAEQGIDL
jgi:hypothetical protein